MACVHSKHSHLFNPNDELLFVVVRKDDTDKAIEDAADAAATFYSVIVLALSQERHELPHLFPTGPGFGVPLFPFRWVETTGEPKPGEPTGVRSHAPANDYEGERAMHFLAHFHAGVQEHLGIDPEDMPEGFIKGWHTP